MTGKDLLQALSGGRGVSGYESDLVPLLDRAFQPLVDQVREDKLGNLIMLRRGNGAEPRKKIMLAAHMDEIGLVVTGYEPGVFCDFQYRCIDDRVLFGPTGGVHGRRELAGVKVLSSHIQEPGNKINL